MKIADSTISLKEALIRWDNNDIVWTVERGGIGPGYEQVIQIGVFELCKDIYNNKIIPLNNKKMNKFFDDELNKTMSREPKLTGLSGAQAGALKHLAYRFLVDGYKQTLKSAEKAKAKLIMVQKDFI